MSRKGRRLSLIGAALAVLGVAAALILTGLRDSVVFFHSPTEIVEKAIRPGQRIRVGGLVADGSVKRDANLLVRFDVTDGSRSVPVTYVGILPDLFREGQGVVAEGALDAAGLFRANTVLAKHDERYMPREVADALRKQGRWREGEGPVPEPKPTP